MEMVGDKERRDNQLDQLGIALDARLAQWQVMRNVCFQCIIYDSL